MLKSTLTPLQITTLKTLIKLGRGWHTVIEVAKASERDPKAVGLSLLALSRRDYLDFFWELDPAHSTNRRRQYKLTAKGRKAFK